MLENRVDPLAVFTGDALSRVVLSPSWPREFPPQHHATPNSSRPQVCWPPAAIPRNLCASATRTPTTRLSRERSPSCPCSFSPQHHADPSRATAQLCHMPEDMVANGASESAESGTSKRLLELPS